MNRKKPTPIKKKDTHSKQHSRNIDEACKDYFSRNLTAFTCVKETGFSKDAVYDRYDKLAAECQSDTGYIQRQIVVKERYAIALDQLQIKLENQIKRFESAIKANKLDTKLETGLSFAIQTLSKIYNDKANVEVTPTLDISLKKVIKERWNIDLDELAKKQPST